MTILGQACDKSLNARPENEKKPQRGPGSGRGIELQCGRLYWPCLANTCTGARARANHESDNGAAGALETEPGACTGTSNGWTWFARLRCNECQGRLHSSKLSFINTLRERHSLVMRPARWQYRPAPIRFVSASSANRSASGSRSGPRPGHCSSRPSRRRCNRAHR